MSGRRKASYRRGIRRRTKTRETSRRFLEDDDQLQMQEEEGPDVVSEGEHKPFYKSVHKKLNTKAAPYEEHKTATKFGGISSLEPTVGS